MPPLPSTDNPYVQSLPLAAKTAYIHHILPAEHDIGSANNDRKLMHIRVLGALLIHAPSKTASECVAQEIASATTDLSFGRHAVLDRLERLGKLYLDHFICLFKKAKGRTPSTSSPSSDHQLARVQHEPIETPRDHACARRYALIRDGFRCMLSGHIDWTVWKANTASFPPPAIITITYTNCCHIMPESTNSFASVNDPELKVEWASGVWTILDRFGYGDIRQELEGHAVHRLENVLTLRQDLCNLFDSLDLWLEPVLGKEHAYTVHTYPLSALEAVHLTEQVQFSIHDMDLPGYPRPDAAHLPLPNSRYLELHAACCKVAHTSGAAEYLDQMIRDVEETKVLAEDGGSADVLDFAIMSRLATPV